MATSEWHFPLSYHKMCECSGNKYICNLPVHVYIYIINVNYNSQCPVGKEFRSSLCQCDAYDSMPLAGLEIRYTSSILTYHHGCIFKIHSLTCSWGWFPLPLMWTSSQCCLALSQLESWLHQNITLYRDLSQAEAISFWWPCNSCNIGCANSMVRKASLNSTYVGGEENSASPLKGRAVKEFTDLF